MVLSSWTSWHLIPCSTHPSFALQTLGIPNRILWDTNSGYTKPRTRSCVPETLNVLKYAPTLNQLNVTSIHKGTSWYLIRLQYALLKTTKFLKYSSLLQLQQQWCTIQNLLRNILPSTAFYHFRSLSISQSNLLTSHHPYQQLVFPFPASLSP